MRGSPGAETPIKGQGFGLRRQNCRKSWAKACGRMARLPCTKPGATPEVEPTCWLCRSTAAAAIVCSCMIAITWFCPFYHQRAGEKQHGRLWVPSFGSLLARRCYTDFQVGGRHAASESG